MSLLSKFLEHPIVTTDSRNCPEGSIFFALKGENFNGNKFAAQALEKGCAYAVVDEKEYAVDDRYICVDDTLKALQLLAYEYRNTLNIPVIGITGTNGKTTTKELVSTVLSKKYNVLYTQGNLNNHIGVPLTLLRLRKEHEIAVIEMGANHPKEIEFLTGIACPTCGIITNVGKAHLEGFGSFEKLVNTKCELYDYLGAANNTPTIFVNHDDDILLKRAMAFNATPKTYGVKSAQADIKGEIIDCDPFLRFKLFMNGSEYKVTTHLVGSYNIYNALAAATIGKEFNVNEEDIVAALSDYVPSNNRSQFTETANNKLVVDTYNANPTSMMAALENFTLMSAPNKMAILGEMRELGSISAEEHQRVADFLKSHGINDVWLVGAGFTDTVCNFRKFPNSTAVKAELTANPIKGKCILIKGSNGNRLFELPELL